MTIFGSYVGSRFPNIGDFEVYWWYMKVYELYLRYMKVYEGV